MPSTLSRLWAKSAPALLTRTSSRACHSRKSRARRRTSACDDRSATRCSTEGLPVFCRIDSAVASHRSRLRPTSTTRAPRRASSRAVTSPMPAVAPVTRQVLPAIDVSWPAMRYPRRPASIKPFAHADPLLDGVAQPLVEGDHAGVRRADLQVDLEATALGQGVLQAADQGCPDAAAPGRRPDGHRVNPAAVAVVAAHGRPDHDTVAEGNEEQLTLDRELLAYRRRRVVVRRGVGQHLGPQVDDGRLVRVLVGADLHAPSSAPCAPHISPPFRIIAALLMV